MLDSKDDKNHQSADPLEENPIRKFFISKIDMFKAYWRTRSAVIEEGNLHDLTREELRERKLLGPWTFNLYENFLATIPTIIIFKVISFFMPTDDVIKQADQIKSWIEPIMFPIYLTLLAKVVAKGSLKKADISQKKLVRAKYAYLYIDGAFGILPQSLAVLGLTIYRYMDFGYLASDTNLILISSVLMLIGSSHAFYMTWYNVPRRLFVINGYDPDMLDHKKNAPSNSAPYRRYGKVFSRAAVLHGFSFAIVYQAFTYILPLGSDFLRKLFG